MPEFVLNRTYNLIGKGHNIRFEKGLPVWVPPELVKEAVGIGAECVDGKVDVLPPEETPPEQLTPADKEALVFAAFDQIIAKNDTKDFGGDGKPSVEAVKRVVEFAVTKKEINAWMVKYREAKAAEE